MKSIVTVSHLTKHFGQVTAVDDLSLEIGESEFFTMLGPSGCGKTTTLRCIAGLETADAGEITIGGTTVFSSRSRAEVPTHKRQIGMVFQSYAVWPHMSVFENIGYPLRIRGVNRSAIAKRVDAVLDILDMTGLGQRMPSQLSGGQQQRVALGRALAVEPRVLLLDEPLSNLDAKLRDQMRAELKRIQRETGLPIIYVTHDQIEALAMSDRVAVMSDGRLHQLAPPTEIYSRPETRFVLDFIGSVNYLPCRIAETTEAEITCAVEEAGLLSMPRPERVPDSDKLELAVRPEDVVLLPAAQKGLPATVELRSFLGEAFEYHLRIGGRTVRVRTEKSVDFAEGASIGLAISNALLLDGSDRAPGQSLR